VKGGMPRAHAGRAHATKKQRGVCYGPSLAGIVSERLNEWIASFRYIGYVGVFYDFFSNGIWLAWIIRALPSEILSRILNSADFFCFFAQHVDRRN